MFFRRILILALICVSLPVGPVLAVALKVSPAEVKIESRAGTLAQQEILVENPGKDVALFEVYPDDFADLIQASPKSFTLQSGQSQKVILEVQGKETGVFSTNLSVAAKPLAQEKLTANSGIKIPCQINVSDRKNSPVFSIVNCLIFILLLVAAVLGVLLFREKKRIRVTGV